MIPKELALAFIFLLSGFTMSFTGFGFALVSVPALALFLPVQSAVALQFPYCFCLSLYQAWYYRAYFEWSSMRPLFAGTILGLPIGAFMLHYLPGATLKKALAIFIAAVVIFNALPLTQVFMKRHTRSPWWGHFCGFLSGSFLSAFTIGGPPAAMYIMSVTPNPLKVKSSLASFFSMQYILIAFLYVVGGMFNWEMLGDTLIFSPAVAAGSALGFWAFTKASNLLYRKVLAVMLLVTAMLLWWRA
ncbi:MAG: sulfite exporter TauE/SafE family protein [Desulfobaccales bacterium]